MTEYPYIQDKKKITNFVCDICKRQTEVGFIVEWRVDIFQGNCEFEKTCNPCIGRQLNEIKHDHERRAKLKEEREVKYEAKMKPKWERLESMLAENNISVKKYPNTGQWVLNNSIDWWTTTGTAIHRKNRKEFYFTVDRPEKILAVFKQSKQP